MAPVQRTIATATALLAFLQPFGHGHSHAELAGVELRLHLILYHGGKPPVSTGIGWHFHSIVLSGQYSSSPRAEASDELDQPSLRIWNSIASDCLQRHFGCRCRLHVDCRRTHHEMPCVLLI